MCSRRELLIAQEGRPLEVEVQAIPWLFARRRPRQAYAPGEVVRASRGEGRLYLTVLGGYTGSSVGWRDFPATTGGTLQDGTVLWEAVELSDPRLPTYAHAWEAAAPLAVTDRGALAPFTYSAQITGGLPATRRRLDLVLTGPGGRVVTLTRVIETEPR